MAGLRSRFLAAERCTIFLAIAIDAFRDHPSLIALVATLSIVYGTVRRAPIPAWLGLFAWGVLVGVAAIRTISEPVQAEEQVLPEGACVREGTTTFCHELRHVRTSATEIVGNLLSSDPAVVTLGFDFEGRRSYRTAKREVIADFRLAMHGVSEAVVSDYPDLMAQVIPSPAELERYRIGRFVDISVSPQAGTAIDPAAMSSAFGLDGILLPNGNYVMIEYVPVAESLAACLALDS